MKKENLILIHCTGKKLFLLVLIILSSRVIIFTQDNDYKFNGFKLTPDAFSNTNPHYPFKLNKKDYFIMSAALGIYITEKCISNPEKDRLTLEEIRKLNRSNVNGFDRSTTNNRNTDLGNTGDIVEKVLPVLPVIMLAPQLYKKEWNNAISLGVMYIETYFLTQGITGILKSVTHRVRPIYYNTSFTSEERFNLQENYEAPEGKTSFISGHASRTFASAVWMSKIFTDTYGRSKWSYMVWGISLSAASFTAYTRVADGEHFPTDVIAGAIVGSTIGYIIPELHKVKNEKLSFAVMPRSLTLVYSF